MKAVSVFPVIFCLLICQAMAGQISRCRQIKENVGTVISFKALRARGRGIALQGLLVKPSGETPAPAIVLLHRVFGIEPPDCYMLEQQRYADMGFVSLLVDSTSIGRAHRVGHDPTTINGYDNADQAADAVSALQFLSRQPFVDRDRIVLVGHAHGGSSVMRGVVGDPTVVSASQRGYRFAAAIALHPACPLSAHALIAPTLIVIGERDSINSARACLDSRRRSQF